MGLPGDGGGTGGAWPELPAWISTGRDVTVLSTESGPPQVTGEDAEAPCGLAPGTRWWPQGYMWPLVWLPEA